MMMTMTMMTAMLIEEQNYSDEAPMDTCIEKFFLHKSLSSVSSEVDQILNLSHLEGFFHSNSKAGAQ